jgi:hypothetical protein
MPGIESFKGAVAEPVVKVEPNSPSQASDEAAFQTHLGDGASSKTPSSYASSDLLLPKEDVTKSTKDYSATGGEQHKPNVLRKSRPLRPETSAYKQRMTRAEPYSQYDPETGGRKINTDEPEPSTGSRLINMVAEGKADGRAVTRTDIAIANVRLRTTAMLRGHLPTRSGIAKTFTPGEK